MLRYMLEELERRPITEYLREATPVTAAGGHLGQIPPPVDNAFVADGCEPFVKTVLPTDAATRERIPLCAGVLDYFPLALAAVANCSLVGNEQHNVGQPMHWARGKSTAHADKIMKHLVDRGTFDTDGVRHSAKLAWRALALLQEELEKAGGEPGRGSQFTSKEI